MAMMLLDNNSNDPFKAAAGPVVSLINSATGPLLAIVVALGAIYSIFLGVKLAKAEEPQDKMKAKGQLKNAIIGFILIFVLIVVLRVATGPMLNWVNGQPGTQGNINMAVPTSTLN
ncbi:MAG: hypothetical protein J6N53_04330 [Lachnospiraceae bacterium]|nr:hypothetical protein [Lachnospiraceae bacterium]MBO6298052.1 hypothetical protein [Lachnospiraceae bacterium]MBP3296525.1 hypothetical protein [Lachnospiraceae bacterium]